MRFAALLCLAWTALAAPRYELLLQGGHVIDPANNRDGVMDVAIAEGKIAKVAANIPPADAARVVDVKGLYVAPGLIDLHAHVFGYSGSLWPDDSALPAGTTTVVDAGGSGWRSYAGFEKTVILPARTRVLALINIVGHGMLGPKYEDNTEDMDSAKTAAAIQAHRDHIVGIKTAHFGGTGWTAIDRAVAAGKIAGVPVLIDDKIFTNTGRTSREKVLDHMRPGDLHTHMYNDRQLEVIDRVTGRVQPYMVEARKRGVLFDMGHGAGSFLWPVATRAMAQGFPPDTISTDLHSSSILIPESDMPNCISKLMSLGMKLPDAIARSTVAPAKAIHRFPEIGTLNEGAIADVAVFELRSGVFAYKDAWHKKKLASQKLETALTVRAGKVLYDRDWRLLTQDRTRFSPASPPSAARGEDGATADPSLIFDLVIQNGLTIDPKSGRTAVMDIGIAGNKIRAVAARIAPKQARVLVDADGLLVTPGLVDSGADFDALSPDSHTLPYGVTTAVHKGQAKIPAHTDVKIVPSAASGIATGMNAGNILSERPTMTNILSRDWAKGARLEQLLARATNGSLESGSPADLALFRVEKGTFALPSGNGSRLMVPQRLRCVLTVLAGKVVWDTEGLSLTDWQAAGPYSNFK